ncbi:MAG: hypothetical protein C5B45_06330 [Chlamydiae bacterium]|nr:MAG: hypothetical protein C5B45_06330 [Chlamydiota bacterium]
MFKMYYSLLKIRELIVTVNTNLVNNFVLYTNSNFHPNVVDTSQNTQDQEVQPHSRLTEIHNQAQEWVKLHLNKKLFAHIHADHAIRGTSLEGADPMENAAYLAACLDLIDIPPEIQKKLQTAFTSLVSCTDDQVAVIVKNLTPGHSLLVSGGYTNRSGGHAVLYEFCKREDHAYDIYLYNTGDGIGTYHPQIQKEGIPFYKAVIKFENVLAEELDLVGQSSCFFQYLADLKNSAKHDEEKNAAMLYEKGFGHLAGKLVVLKEDHSLFVKGQYSGTCSWRVLQAFVCKTFQDFASYKKYVFALKLVTLSLFFKQCEKECDLESCMLLEEAVTNLLRSAAKLYHANNSDTTILSEKQTADAYATLQEILQKLPDLKASIVGSPPRLEPIEEKNDFFEVHSSKPYVPPSSIQKGASPLLFSTIDAGKFTEEISKVISHLETFSGGESQIFQIEHFVTALPIPHINRKQDFWQKIPEQHLEQALSLIQEIVERYGSLCLNHPPFFPSQQNTALSLLSFAHRLALRIDEQKSGTLTNYGMWNAFLSYADQQRFFICFEPYEQQRRKELDAYFTSINTGKQQLFNFPLLEGEGSFTEDDHNKKLCELLLFEHAINQDPSSKQTLSDASKVLLQKSNNTWSLKMAQQVMLIAGSMLKEFNSTQHLAILRNISYIAQQFAGYMKSEGKLISQGYRCDFRVSFCSLDEVVYKQHLAWLDSEKLDPSIGFHLLPSKDQAESLVKSLDSFSRLLPIIMEQTEAKLQLQPENIPLPYQKQLETTQCEPLLQPQKLIYYFQEHLEELADLNKQALFDLIFFKQVGDQVPLFQELKSNTFFIQQCRQFIEKGLDRFSQEKSQESLQLFAYLFFVRLIYRLHQIQQDLRVLPLNLPSLQDTLNNWLKSPQLHAEDKACLHLHRMMQYGHLLPVDNISLQQLSEIISSWFYYARAHLLARKMPYLENQATTFIHRWIPHMEKLSEQEQQTVLCQILQTIGMASIAQEMIEGISSQFPLYTLTLKNKDFWKLHLLTAQIENSKGLVESASSKRLQQAKEYQDLFADKVFDIYKSEGYYRFFCEEKGEIRIHTHEEECDIESHIDGSWYRYIPESALIETKLPVALIEGHWHWHSIQHNEMRIISKKNHQVVAKVRTTDKGNNRCTLLEMKNLQQEQILYPTEELDSLLSAIHRIESPDWCLVYRDRDQRFTRMHFPRLYSTEGEKLEFILAQAEARFAKDQHFILMQPMPGLMGFLDNYLVLEDVKRQKKKVLVPVQEVKKSQHFSPEGISLCFPSTDQPSVYLEFDCRFEKLFPINKEGILFLAYLYLAQKDYVEAVKYLQQIRKADSLSEIAISILAKFLNLSKLNQDQHPSAAAIRLKALCLLRSKNNYEMTKKQVKGLIDDYLSYTTRISNVDSRFLLTSEEKQHCSFLASHFPPSPFLQTWGQAQSVFHPRLPLQKIQDADWIMQHCCDSPDSLLYSVKNILKDLQQLNALCIAACKAETDEARLSVSTQLYFMANQQKAAELSPYKQVAFAVMHFALKHPASLPDSLTPGGPEWLQAVLQEYQKKYQTQNPNAGQLTPSSSAEDGIFHVKDERISQRLQKQCLPFSQGQIQQALILPNVTPENRCFALSSLADMYFTQKDACVEGCSFQPERIEKEDYKQAIERGYQDFQRDLAEGIKINQSNRESILDRSKIEELSCALKKLLKPDLLEEQKRRILELANAKPLQYALQNHLLEKGRCRSPVDLQQLICAFLRGDAQDYYQLNFYLQVQEIQQLDYLLQKFLLESTKHCQVQRALVLMDILKQKEDTAVHQELYAVLTEKMAYDPSHRVLLVYEYQAKIRVRQNQMELISKITAEPKDVVAQLIMGGGKTSVLASILLAILAKPPQLAVFIPPAAQFDTLRNNLKTTQHAYFLQELIPIELTRSEFSVEKLQEVYQKLVQAQSKGWAVLIQKETVQSFALELQSALYKREEAEKIAILRNIVQIFKRSAHALFDECDLQFSPMQEVNFTLGEKKQIDPIYITCGAEIFKTLVSNQLRTVNQKHSLAEFVGLLQNAQSFMPTKDYYEQVLPVIAEELFASYKDTLLLSDEDKEHFLSYVQGKMISANLTQEENEFLTGLKTYASSLDDLEKEAAALIAWIKMQFTEVLPLTLSKDTNRHYGRIHTQEKGKVVPYKGVNSPATTQFGSPWEALAYQFQTALSQKLSLDLIKEYIQKVYQTAEYRSYSTQVPMEETKEAQDFLQLTNISLSQAQSESGLKKVWENINEDVGKILEVEAEFAVHLIGYYPCYLHSNASHLSEQFAAVIGFSGTPWNASCYPKDLSKNVLSDLGTEGKILDMACRKTKKNPHAIHVITNTDFQEVLQICLQNHPHQNQVRAFIDVAGICKDYDNQYIAEQILTYFKDKHWIEHVLFFGRANLQEHAPNTLMALQKGNSIPVVIGSTHVQELAKRGIDPKSTFIYYDECHCEATDLPQISDAINLLSSNGSMILRDLLQGMLRARGYLEKQDIEYVIHENTIRQLGIQGKPTFENAVLNPSIVNQAERKAKETYRAFLHEIDQVFFKSAWEHLLDTPEQITHLFDQYRDIFLHDSEVDCFTQYGSLLEKEFGLQSLQKYANDRLQHWKQVQPDLLLWGKVEENMQEVLKRASSCKFLPNLVEVTLSTLGMEQQVDMQQETELKMDVELENELESYQYQGTAQSRTESIWDFQVITLKTFLKTEDKSWIKKTPMTDSSQPKTYLLSDFVQSYPHLKPYDQIFTEQKILITENAMYTSTDLCSIFSRTRKPAHQILIVEEQKQFYAVILSIKEAKAFKEYLTKHQPVDMWLVLPNAEKLSLPKKRELYSNLQQEMPEHRDWLLHTLWFVNFLNGDMHYLAAHRELTETIIQEKDTELKLRFLKLKTLQDPQQKAIFHHLTKDILGKNSRANRIQFQQRRVEQRKAKEFAQALTEQAIGKLSQEDHKYIPYLDPKKVGYLKNSNLIQQLNSSQIKEVLPNQVAQLSSAQLRHLDKPEQIQKVTKEGLDHLLPHQIHHLTMEQAMDLPDKKIQYLTQKLLAAIDPVRISPLYQGKHLLDSQLKQLTETQLKALLQENAIEEILPHLENNQLQHIEKKEQIQAIPLELVKHLVETQIPSLREVQISEVSDLQYKHLTTEQFAYKYSWYSAIFMFLEGWILWNLRILAYICGIYLLKRVSFLRFFGSITDRLDRSNTYLGIGYRKLQGK